MKDLFTVMVIAVAGAIIFEASSGNSFCFGNDQPKIGDNSTCNNATGLAVSICQMKCLLCQYNNVSSPFGCLTGTNGTCQCIGKLNGNGTVPSTTPPAPISSSSSADSSSLPQTSTNN